MGAVYFYHLTRAPLEAALQQLLLRALDAGWRVELRGTDAARMAWLDEKLWLEPEESFLPHGLAGGTHDADQPVLLSVGPSGANSPDCVMAVDGAGIAPHEAPHLQRGSILFDGNDPAAVAAARDQWRALTGAGIAAQYWSQASGRWEMKAEKPAQG